MKHVGSIQIETERLILRKFTIEDAEDMYKNYTSKDKVTEYLTWDTHKSIQDTKDYLNFAVLPEYEKLSTYRWAVVWKENNEVIGAIDVVDSNDTKLRAELGWVLSDQYWGRGIMPEAAREVIKLLFEVGYTRIQAKHHVDNPKSGRVMEKVGMTKEGVLKKYEFDRHGNLADCVMWALIKKD